MKKTIFTLTLCISMSLHVLSQNVSVQQVFVLNEGYFDYTNNQIGEPVTLGVYDPNSQTYQVLDTITGARFASDMLIDDNYLYVAADNKLYKYNKNTYNLIASQQINGIRNLAIWNDKIIVTRGDYDNVTYAPILYNSYLQVFNKNDLSFHLEFDTINGPKWSTQNLVVKDNNLYVAINNAYEWGNYKGIIGVVDLNSFSYTSEIDLGADGVNPDNMMIKGDYVYTVNNKDWSGSSISKVDLLSNTHVTTNLALVSTGCGTSCLRDDKINYQLSGDVSVYEWDVNSTPSTGSALPLNNNFYELAFDNVNNLLYASTTDYFSYGNVNIYDANNILIHSFSTGVSPGTIVFDNVTSSSPVSCAISAPTNLSVTNIIQNRATINWDNMNSSTSQLPVAHYVNAGNYYYNPSVLNINVGDTVYWINDGGYHNVNFDFSMVNNQPYNNPVSFITNPTTSSNMASYVFTVPGTYNYDCSVGAHAINGMVGTVVVNQLPAPTQVCFVDQYRIKFRPVGSSTWTQKTMGQPVGSCLWACNKVEKLILNLIPNTTYEYQMKAWYCGGGASAWTSLHTFTTAPDCPNVGNLAVTTPTTTKATFTWDDSNGTYSFMRIKARVDVTGSAWFNVGGTGVAHGTFTKNKNGLTPGESYRGQARTWCDPNGGAYKSPSWTSLIYWTQPTVRMEVGTTISNLDVYPNPSRDMFNVTFTSEDVQDLEVRVMNVVGEVVYTENLEEFVGEYTKKIDLATYTKGVYFLEITTNNGVVNKKLILQ